MMRYSDELRRAMTWLGEQERTIFVGQAVTFPGTAIFRTLENVPAEKLVELPVFEETQMGLSTGLALAGLVPVSIYPRWNFLLLATNQLVNHLDKLPTITHGKVSPKVIVRTMVGSRTPLYPGAQHSGDFTEAFRLMLDNVLVIELTRPGQIVPHYKAAYHHDGSTLLVERGDLYDMEE